MPSTFTDTTLLPFNTGTTITETKLEQLVENTNAVVRAGGATGLAPTTASATRNTSTNETSVRTMTDAGNTTGWLVPAGLIGTDRKLVVEFHGEMLANSGTPTIRFRGYLRDGVGGNTLLYDWTSDTIGASATRRPIHAEICVMALGSVSSQLGFAYVTFPQQAAGTINSGIVGDANDSGQWGGHPVLLQDDAPSAVNMTAAVYMDFTVAWSASNAALEFEHCFSTLVVK